MIDKFRLLITLLLTVCASLPLPEMTAPQSQNYKIDNAHTSVIFAINHFNLSYTYGRFNQCSGSFAIENGQPTAAGFSFTIDTTTIDTNNDERDEYLRGPEFFNSETFPEITFTTTGIQKVNNEYRVTGDLKMLDQIRSITLPVQMTGIGKGPFGDDRAGFITKFTIKRSEFGMDKMIGSIGDNVAITFSFEGVRE